ncbi:YgfZ/GcvT domain-containing protein [Longispora albida]|uniref:CAF17-like 4Fe-4S cluster assembly/insertion protein YgfZ n=1 Tax=Longispora albida TaxID=203523 RepID=UPI00058EF788|nr:folate-binding protein YgfZ [Longispora albida]
MNAVMGEGRDAGVPVHYGDPAREQRILANEAGLVDRSHRGVIAVPGEDRLSWLHDLTTQYLHGDVSGTELLFLSPHGHVEHHAVLADVDGTAWLDVEGAPNGLLEYLHRMRFLLRVEPCDMSQEMSLYSLVGPEAALAGIDLGPVDELPVPGPKFASADLPKRPSVAYPVAPLPGGGFARRMPYGIDLMLPRGSKYLDEIEVPWCGLWAFEAMRVEAHRPRLGFETDHKTLPAEVDWLASAVHLDKGCYRGQETIARVHNLGRPPRRLVLLHLDGVDEELPAVGSAVELDGRAVGFVGTTVRHHELGQVALAVLKRSVADDAKLKIGARAAAID